MKKFTLFTLSLFTFSLCSAQIIEFTLADPQPDLVDVYAGSFASGDIDGDGDQDLLIAGQTPSKETALYLNDGAGNFTEVTSIPFPEATDTVTIFEDLDLDGDLDLFFSGNGPADIQEFAHIYLNDGMGVFSQLTNPFLPQFLSKGAAIEDVDDDGDKDILVSALDKNNNFVADVYLNDGNANFTPLGSTGITPVKFASIAFIDVENDGDSDVIISGTQENDAALTRLYLNDGLGNFSPETSTNFEQLAADDVDVADTDNDGDLDILMSGSDNDFNVRTILYVNDGDGQFTELSTGMQETFAGANAIADLDDDGDQDIVIVGSQDGGVPNIFTIVYENVGNNEFLEAVTAGGEYIAACVVDDFNGDQLPDIIIQGIADRTNVFWNSSDVLGISDTSHQLLKVYPNPASNRLLISASDVIQSATLHNLLGQELFVKTGPSTQLELDVSAQPSGTYLLKIQTQNGTETLKIVKE